MTVFKVSFREPSTAAIHIAPYRGRPAIVFRSTFVVPAVAEAAQISPAHGQSDLHRDRREWTACLARSCGDFL